jgi:hypothetical protein
MPSDDSKGDYKLVMEEEGRAELRDNSFSQSPNPGGRQQQRPLDLILNHPALPVASYCVASILMTASSPCEGALQDYQLTLMLVTGRQQ